MRILIVEDHDWRASEVARAIVRGSDVLRGDVLRAKTAAHARVALGEAPDVIVLDHDLDLDGTLPEAGSGTEVVVELERTAHDEKPLVIVHSKNVAGAVAMVCRLIAAGYPTAWIPMARAGRERSAPHQVQALKAIVRGWETA